MHKQNSETPRGFSICMATYNGSEFVKSQITSILDDMGSDDELIIVDDASTDTTVEIAHQFTDSRIRLFQNTANRGYVRTFERAIQLSTKEMIAFSDQDDVWRRGHLDLLRVALGSAQVAATNLATHGGADRIPGPYRQKNWRFSARSSSTNLWNIGMILAGDMPYYGCTMALTREALDVLLPFPDFLTESHDLWFALYGNLNHTIRHVPLRTVERRFHAANTSPSRPRGVAAALRSRALLIHCMAELHDRLSETRLIEAPKSHGEAAHRGLSDRLSL